MATSKGCLPTAVKLLAARDHSEHDLRRKLSRRFDEADIDAAVAILKTRGYLDDAALARRQASRYIADGGHGRIGIIARLEGRGLPAEAIDAALAGYDTDGEYERAAALVKRQFPWAAVADAPKVGRFLAARGFAAETITTLLGRVFDYYEGD